LCYVATMNQHLSREGQSSITVKFLVAAGVAR